MSPVTKKKSRTTTKSVRKSDRRRKPGIHGRGRKKLTAPEIPGFHTAFVNDLGTRLYDKTVQDDYEYVTREEVGDFVGEDGKSNNDLGSRVRVLVDKSENGEPIYAYLLKKKVEYFNSDRQEMEDDRMKREDELRRGNDRIENQYGEIR